MSYDDESTASALELDDRDRIRSFETSATLLFVITVIVLQY
jgi:hypothetical protein